LLDWLQFSFAPQSVSLEFMKSLVLAAATATLIVGAAGAVSAQPPGDHTGWGQDPSAVHHWSRGERMGYYDWNGAQRVDYRQHHLSAPPSGYEWRESNGQYVLGAIATGVIATAVLESGR
jgi:opacity protein-like surface antigen